MQIGDLPRAGTARRATWLGRTAFGALSVTLVMGLLGAWQLIQPAERMAQPLPQEETNSLRAAAAPGLPEAGASPPQPALPENPPPALQVAGADPTQSYAAAASPPPPPSAPAAPDPEPAPPAAPDQAGGDGPIPAATAADATPLPTMDMAEAAIGLPASATPNAPGATGAGETGSIAAPEPSDGSVDLNTGSFEELNTLEGGGPIGRAIINGRPYASTEELVTKKVVRRSVYEQIKDLVTVR